MNKILLLAIIVLVGLACASKSQNANGKGFSNVDVAGAKKMISENKDLVIIDVRTPGEIADGKIDSALEIDYRGSDFKDKINKLDKSKKYLIYCRSGGRSSSASDIMISSGFNDVTNMKGGFSAWSKN